MMNLSNKKGISLVSLVVTIIVILILSGVIILTVTNDSPIEDAKEAVLKNDIMNMKEEYELAKSESFMKNMGEDSKINSNDFVGVIPDKYKESFKATNDGLVYVGNDEWTEKIAKEMGISKKEYNVIENINIKANKNSVEIETIILSGEIVDEYIYQIRVKGTQDWEEFSNTSNKLIINNLIENKIYEVKVRVKQGEKIYESDIKEVALQETQAQLGTLIMKINDVNGAIYTNGEWTNEDVYLEVQGEGTTYSVSGANTLNSTANSNILKNEGESIVTIKAGDNSATYTVRIDKSLPEIKSLEKNKNIATNGSIIITGKAIDTLSGIVAYQFSTNENLTGSSAGWNQIENKKSEISQEYTVNQNDKYYFYVKDNVGNVSKQEIIINNIDKKSPTDELPTLTSTTNSVTVKSNQTDESNIIKVEVAIREKGQSTWDNWTEITKDSYTYSGLLKNKEYEVKTKTTDEAGNTSESKVSTIKTLDLTKPTLSASTQTTNQEVTVTISYPKISGTTRWYSTDGTAWIETTKYELEVKVSKNNTTVYAKINDTTGQTSGNASWEVTNIDDVLPKINNVTKNTSELSRTIILIGKAIDKESGITAYQFSTDENLTKESSGWNYISTTNEEITRRHIVEENNTYFFYVRDVAGNVTKKSIVIDNIAPDAPIPFAVYSETDNSLRFYNRADIPNVGDNYNNLVATAIYTRLENTNYSWFSPWQEDYEEEITSIIFEDEIEPLNTSNWFFALDNVSIVNVEKLNTSNVTNMNRMFGMLGYYADSITISGIENWDTSSVTNMSEMFSSMGKKNATSVIIGNLNTKIVNLEDGTSYKAWDVSNVTDMSKMFAETGINASVLDIGKLSNWDTSKVTKMKSMFGDGTEGLHEGEGAFVFDIGNINTKMVELDDGTTYKAWDVSNVTDMSYMFSNVGARATTFNIGILDDWDTSSVTTMESMFCDTCIDSTEFSIGKLDNWNTSNVTNMRYMFSYAGAETDNFDIGNLDTKIVEKEDGTTYKAWDVSNVVDMSLMFCGTARNSKTFDIGNISNWNISNVDDMGGLFLNVCNNISVFDKYDFSTKIATLSNGEKYIAWNTSNVTDMGSVFSLSNSNIDMVDVNIDSISNWNTSKVENMRDMFEGISATNTIKFCDLSTKIVKLEDGTTYTAWDVSNVTNMSGMFSDFGRIAKNIQFPDIGNWNTSKLESMYQMFEYMGEENVTIWNIGDLSTKIVELEDGTTYKAWDVSNVTNMEYAFMGIGNNTEYLDISFVSNWNTSNVTDMGSMFYGIGGENTEIIFGDLNTKQVSLENGTTYTAWDVYNLYSMRDMFSGITGKEPFELNLSKWKPHDKVSMLGVFEGSNIRKVDLYNLHPNITREAFDNCKYLEEVIIGDNFTFSKDGLLPVPNPEYITGADGKWYSVTTGIAYLPEEIPDKTSDKYVARKLEERAVSNTLIDGKSFGNSIPNVANCVIFTNKIAPSYANLVDVSQAQDSGVVAWLDGTTYYVSTQGNAKILANQDSSYLFYGNPEGNGKGNLLTNIDLSNLDTSNVTNMEYMFKNCNYLKEVIIGEKFSFLGDGSITTTTQYLPIPNSKYISRADGYWYNSQGQKFESNAIYNNVADKYKAFNISQDEESLMITSDMPILETYEGAYKLSNKIITYEMWQGAIFKIDIGNDTILTMTPDDVGGIENQGPVVGCWTFVSVLEASLGISPGIWCSISPAELFEDGIESLEIVFSTEISEFEMTTDTQIIQEIDSIYRISNKYISYENLEDAKIVLNAIDGTQEIIPIKDTIGIEEIADGAYAIGDICIVATKSLNLDGITISAGIYSTISPADLTEMGLYSIQITNRVNETTTYSSSYTLDKSSLETGSMDEVLEKDYKTVYTSPEDANIVVTVNKLEGELEASIYISAKDEKGITNLTIKDESGNEVEEIYLHDEKEFTNTFEISKSGTYEVEIINKLGEVKRVNFEI